MLRRKGGLRPLEVGGERAMDEGRGMKGQAWMLLALATLLEHSDCLTEI